MGIDSEALDDLSCLQDHVKKSHYLVVLLTPGFLTRPWCLVEIVTAHRHDVQIVPVEVQRPGVTFNYPNDEFYSRLRDGKFLDDGALDLLRSEGIQLSELEAAIRR